MAASLNARYGESNRERLRHIFKDVPVLYGFSSKAPLGRYAGPLLDRYFQTAPPAKWPSGRPSATLLELFGPASMIAVPGLTDADPHAGFRGDMCGFADDKPSDAQKVAFMHDVLRRDVTEVRMFLDHVERYAGSIGAAQRARPDVAAALAAIEADRGTRERFLEFARDADQATVQARMFGLARVLGWLTPEQEQAEFVQMLARRMASDRIGKHEVDLVCSTHPTPRPALARQLQAAAVARPDRVAHAATLACLGDAPAHERTVRALTSSHDDDVAVAQTYLRHRPLDGVDEVRAVVSSVARMTAAGAQVRALETLARQRLADPQSLQEIARLFPRARSLQVQRAIAGILIRSDTQMLARSELARSLRQHRLKSPDGSDVIDMLIRLLQAVTVRVARLRRGPCGRLSVRSGPPCSRGSRLRPRSPCRRLLRAALEQLAMLLQDRAGLRQRRRQDGSDTGVDALLHRLRHRHPRRPTPTPGRASAPAGLR